MAVVLFFVLRPSAEYINNEPTNYPSPTPESTPHTTTSESSDYTINATILARFVLYSDFYTVNGEHIQESAVPFVHPEMGITMVPLRVLARLINATNIRWVEDTQTAALSTADGGLLTFAMNVPLFVDGVPVGGNAVFEQGSVFIPIRYIALRTGLELHSDPATGAIYLVSPLTESSPLPAGVINNPNYDILQFNFNSPIYTRNGEAVHALTTPIMHQIYQPMLPLDTLADIMETRVDWSETTQTANLPNTTLSFTIAVPVDSGTGSPIYRDGNVFIPLRHVADILEADFFWNNNVAYLVKTTTTEN